MSISLIKFKDEVEEVLTFQSPSYQIVVALRKLKRVGGMEYTMSVGLSFETAATALKQLYQKEAEFTNPASERRLMLWWDKQERSLKLVEFDLERAIASLNLGKPVIPVLLDRIHQQLASKLKE